MRRDPSQLTAELLELDRLKASENWKATEALARDLLKRTDDVHGRISLSLRLAEALARTDGLEEAGQLLSDLRYLLDTVSDEELRARWHLGMCLVSIRRGDYERSEVHAFASLACADLLQNAPWLTAAAHANLGLTCMHRGEWTPARRHFVSASEEFRRAGDDVRAVRHRVNLAIVLYWSGDWADASIIASDALQTAQRIGAIQQQTAAALIAAMLARAAGDSSRAAELLRQARAVSSRSANLHEEGIASEIDGDIALDLGHLDKAGSCYEFTIAKGILIAPAGDLVYEGRRKLAEVRRRQGRLDEAKSLAANALELARKAGTVVEIGASLRVLAVTEHAMGTRDAARRHALEGITLLRGINERYELAQTLVGTADFLDEPRTLLLEARALAAQLGLEKLVNNIDARLAHPAPQPHSTVDPTLVAECATPRVDAAEQPLPLEQLRIASGGVFLTTDPRILDDIRRATKNESRILIEGESGTGKELVARLLHEGGNRRSAPFIAVECTSLHEALAQSELFGHLRGAFTGAVGDRKGLVEAANGGTLFLDEVGDLPLPLQGRLLRLLQEKEFRPLGSSATKTVDIRIIAATNRRLSEEVEAGRFRRDLYYRLHGAYVKLPPLRERPDDILPLARYYLDMYASRAKKRLRMTRDVEAIFVRYAWPGNVRQLEFEVENIAAQLDDGDRITTAVLSPGLVAAAASGTPVLSTFRARMDAALIEEVQRALRATGGNRQKTADMLGFSRRGLQKMLKRVGLTTPTAPQEGEAGESESDDLDD